MKPAGRAVLLLALASTAAGCSGPPGTGESRKITGGQARVVVDAASYDVRSVEMTITLGEDPWFRIDGDPVVHADEDCVPGLSGGLGLYGDLPASVHGPADLAGKRLRVDFSGDGDDANFCFVGMGGLAGAEEAWVSIDSVDGDRATFSMTGTFKIYDENGEGPVKTATATGTAVIHSDS